MTMPIADVFSAAVLLLLVIDPFGNVPIVVSALANVAPARRLRVILRECVAAYVILLAFMFGGQTFLRWLQLSEVSLAIAGGIILFLIALRMVFRQPDGLLCVRRRHRCRCEGGNSVRASCRTRRCTHCCC
jgi:small neutral amino acid transporter SnatA (MarC family)